MDHSKNGIHHREAAFLAAASVYLFDLGRRTHYIQLFWAAMNSVLHLWRPPDPNWKAFAAGVRFQPVVERAHDSEQVQIFWKWQSCRCCVEKLPTAANLLRKFRLAAINSHRVVGILTTCLKCPLRFWHLRIAFGQALCFPRWVSHVIDMRECSGMAKSRSLPGKSRVSGLVIECALEC